MEDMLDKVVKLLAYISDKDLFAEFYRKRLSRRLLQDKSASDDHERAVLTRLKQQCGAQFTSKVGPSAACPLYTCVSGKLFQGSRISTCMVVVLCSDTSAWKLMKPALSAALAHMAVGSHGSADETVCNAFI